MRVLLRLPLIYVALILNPWMPLCAQEPALNGPALPIVDTHVHFWDLDRPEGIYWIAKDDTKLYQTMLPSVHEPIARSNRIDAVVVVQAGQSVPDNQWNLDITAHRKDFYRGVIGNLSKVIGTPEFAPKFQELCKDDRYVGYRLSGRYEEHLSEAFFHDLQLTAQRGKTVDFLVGGYSLAEISRIANKVPSLKIMLDHFGNVRLDDGPLDEAWIEQIRTIAKSKNVLCKVSALYGRYERVPAPTEISNYQPVLDLVFDCFGEDRLVFGSDWPVTRRTGDYAAVIKLTNAYFSKKGTRVCEKVFTRNACTFYGIPSPSWLAVETSP